MGCCCSCFEKCDPCCRRLGCSCKDHDSEGYLASIENNRSCTDVPCILLFIGFITFLVSFVWMTAYVEGDPDRLIRGVNHAGLICGKSEGVENLPYAFWPDPMEFRFKVCTNNCNEATFDNFYSNHVYVNDINAPYPSELYIDKYCIPSMANMSIAGFDSYTNELQRGMGDVETAIPIIGASIAIAFIVSFCYVWLMKCCVGILVWSTVGIIIFGGYAFGYLLYDSSKNIDANLSDNEQKIREYGSYGIFALITIFLFIIIFARNRIRIAIQVIKSAGRSIGDMPMMVFFPLGPICFMIGFFFLWIYSTIFIFSAGNEINNDTPSQFIGETFISESDKYVTNSTFKVIDYDTTIQNQFAPHFFLLLWVVQIFIYFTFTVISGSVADWYFTKRDENGNKFRGNDDGELSNRAVCNSCCRTSRYHFGTIIYAALIIAIIQFIRWCIRYVERTLNSSGKEPNKLQKLLFRLVDCLLWCLECCLDKISRNALIWTSIYGDAFCPSVCGSFKLIWSNLMRVAVITFFATIVTTLGKIMIPLITTSICAAILLFMSPYNQEISSPILPLIIIFIISIAVSMMFLTVYDTAIDTVFMCFLIDEKQNKNNGQMLADEGLRNIVQKYEQESKKLAQSIQRNSGQNETNKPERLSDDQKQFIVENVEI
eukprot:6820_1